LAKLGAQIAAREIGEPSKAHPLASIPKVDGQTAAQRLGHGFPFPRPWCRVVIP